MSFPHRHARRLGAALAVGLCLLLVNRPGTEESVGAAPAAAPAAATAAPVRTTLAGHPVWAHFANPRAHGGSDYTIHAELERLIRNAPRGSTIRGTIHSLNLDSVAKALVDAQTRGVRVRIALDGKIDKSDDGAVTLIRRLTEHTFCTDAKYGCVSKSGVGIMHTKLFTFTATTEPTGAARTDVSWFGSPNLTDASGPEQFNNAITVYGDRTLFAGLNTYFADLYAQHHVKSNDYYDSDSGQGYLMAAAADVYVSPEQVNETDTIVSRLNDLTPDANCRIRIGMKNVTGGRPKLEALIKAHRKAGCQIWMVVGEKSGKIDMNQDVYDDFIKAGIQIRTVPHLHDKFFLALGKYDGVHQARVYTGSQNWTQDALNENDEIFVKMAPESAAVHPLYDGYQAHFNNAYYAGRACTADHDSCY